MSAQAPRPKILILTAPYGAGHIKASRALEAALRELNAVDTEVVDFFDLTTPLLNKFIRSAYRQSSKRAPRLYGAFYRATDTADLPSWLVNQLDRFGRDDLLACLAKHRPGIVVCTYPTPAGLLSRMKTSGEYDGFLATVITDYQAHSQWLHPNVDLYLVAHEGLREDLARRGIDPARIAVTGIPIHPGFFRPTKASASSYGLSPGAVATIMAGGYTGHAALGMVKAVAHLPLGLQIPVLCARNARLAAKIKRQRAKYPRVLALGLVESMEEIMSLSDVLITKAGGVTCSEALAKGLPLIFYRPVPGQEQANANFLTSRGASVSAWAPEELAKMVERLLTDRDAQSEMRQAQARISLPDPAQSAAREILARFDRWPHSITM